MSCPCSNHGENTPLEYCETFRLAEHYTEKDTRFHFGSDPLNNIDLTYDINAKCNYYSNHDFHKITKEYKEKEKKTFSAIQTDIESLKHNFD